LSAKRVGNGHWASAEDVSFATRNQKWNDISYVKLDPSAINLAKNYYLDYPLLFLDVYHDNSKYPSGKEKSALPYLEEISFPLKSQISGNYYLRSNIIGNENILFDNKKISVSFYGQDIISNIYTAKSISIPPESLAHIRLYKPKWYVFK
jgi:hypothetical protein